ncbi:putative metacaspase [Neohortaea acidophila]|uniref:Putative metacaspase n=1 Tax=Neohortaea acidophila TaxID=245834 RepID=A0A6A6Q544_9PEZI|nr:putative metacaspase [Neohortaea acidophila]KAF2487500.1 putative metacaspase [Neohortaea acidophila]
MFRKKSLLIGINYTGSQHALRGCHKDVENVADFLSYRGYSSDPRDQVILRDDRGGPYYPTGHNMLAAMDWLVSEPNTCCFLHYSGHGGQVPNRDRDSGYDDTIVPVDFERNGQIPSGVLHRHLISRLWPNSTLFVIFDCCHSGSALELPFLFRTDDEGNLNMMSGLQQGMSILDHGYSLISGGFDMSRAADAKQLYSEASSFFKSLSGMGRGNQGPGVSEEHFQNDWSREHKWVCMFSGCRDDQTSADANIGGISEGAMSWSFLQVMKQSPNPTFVETLQMTRSILKRSRYNQVPQLSVGVPELDFNRPLFL